MTINEIYSLILALCTALAAGLVGAFAMMKRMSLAGDVMSHIALPGLGLAFLYKINPLLGGAATLVVGIFLIWKLEKKADLTTEATIGVIFAGSVALGAILTPSDALIDALFGGFGNLSIYGFITGIAGALLAIGAIWKLRHKLILGLFSSDIALSTQINVNRLNLYFLLTFGLTIVLGLRFLGAILAGSLIIIPAAIARQLTHTLGAFLAASASASILSVALGFAITRTYRLELGPTVVLVSAVLFVLSFLKKKK